MAAADQEEEEDLGEAAGGGTVPAFDEVLQVGGLQLRQLPNWKRPEGLTLCVAFNLISGPSNGVGAGPSSVGSQTATGRWDRELVRDGAGGGGGGGTAGAGGAFRASLGEKYPDRQALTAALIHFSRALG